MEDHRLKNIGTESMELETAIEILEYHQEWRLGKRQDMVHEPRKLTEALDVILRDIKRLAEVNKQKQNGINMNDEQEYTPPENPVYFKKDSGIWNFYFILNSGCTATLSCSLESLIEYEAGDAEEEVKISWNDVPEDAIEVNREFAEIVKDRFKLMIGEFRFK